MILLFSLICVSVPLWLIGPKLKKKVWIGRLLSCALAALAVLLHAKEDAISGFWPGVLDGALFKGGLAGALFLYVMFVGAAPDHSCFRKTLLPLRGELSVCGSLLAIGHIAAVGLTHLLRLFTSPGELRLWTLLASLFSFLLLVMLLPLFLSSFRFLRRRMKAAHWKKLQRLAYPFYVLLYLHILFFRIQAVREGQREALFSVALYSVLFFAYLSLRLCRAAVRKGHEGHCLSIQLGCMCLLALVLLLVASPEQSASVGTDAPVAAGLRWEDGTYKGAAFGYNGRLKVSVVIENGRIASLELKSHVEDEPYVTRATEGTFAAMLAQNTPDVDSVSSATTTSEALREAVHQALDEHVVQSE